MHPKHFFLVYLFFFLEILVISILIFNCYLLAFQFLLILKHLNHFLYETVKINIKLKNYDLNELFKHFKA